MRWNSPKTGLPMGARAAAAGKAGATGAQKGTRRAYDARQGVLTDWPVYDRYVLQPGMTKGHGTGNHQGGKGETEAWALYEWNIDVTAALVLPLHALERSPRRGPLLAAALFGHGRAGLCVDGLASVFVDGLVACEFCCGFAGGGVVDEVLAGGGGGDEGGGGCAVRVPWKPENCVKRVSPCQDCVNKRAWQLAISGSRSDSCERS